MIENHIARAVRDIEITCPEDCPRFEELEDRYQEMLADWEADREHFRRAYPGEPLPDDLANQPDFPECEECRYEQLKREEPELWKARMLEVD